MSQQNCKLNKTVHPRVHRSAPHVTFPTLAADPLPDPSLCPRHEACHVLILLCEDRSSRRRKYQDCLSGVSSICCSPLAGDSWHANCVSVNKTCEDIAVRRWANSTWGGFFCSAFSSLRADPHCGKLWICLPLKTKQHPLIPACIKEGTSRLVFLQQAELNLCLRKDACDWKGIFPEEFLFPGALSLLIIFPGLPIQVFSF